MSHNSFHTNNFFSVRSYLTVCLTVCSLALYTLLNPVSATEDELELNMLKEMSIENLLDIEVISVSKKAQKLWGSAAAVHVINQEDIRRSGATSIPELLRLAPGINVAKINANSWAITSRGFNGRFSNKLLVLVDGRSVYTPLYSGVYWDVQDMVLSDIERIEVIRGPGATVWGANAVNGVINIITKSTQETHGSHFQARVGDEEQMAAEFRFGGAISDSTSYRVYGKSFKRDGSVDSMQNNTPDDWDGKQVGFRFQSELTPRDSARLQGDLYDGKSGQTITLQTGDIADVAERSGGNIMFSWERILSESSGLNLQLYYDRTDRSDAVTSERRDTYDIDFNHNYELGDRHHINWGLGYRNSDDELSDVPGATVGFNPMQRHTNIWSLFIQDEITLLEDELKATIGMKQEYNSYTNRELQPSARISWTPDENLTLWGAVSGAVRSPSRVESDFELQIPSSTPFVPGIIVLGNTSLNSEELTAFEFGFRNKLSKDLILDATLFYNKYKNLRSVEAIGVSPLPPAPPEWIINQFANKMSGHSNGVEMSADWQISPDWKLKGNYSWLKENLNLDRTSTSVNDLPTEGNSPEHQLKLQSLWNISSNVEFDTTLYYASQLESHSVPAYTRLDLKITWYPRSNIETSLIIQNLLDDVHNEFSLDEGLEPRYVERGIFGQITWKFD